MELESETGMTIASTITPEQSLMAAGQVYNPITQTGIELIFTPHAASLVAPATEDVTFGSSRQMASDLLPVVTVTARLWQVGELLAEALVPVEHLLPGIAERVETNKRQEPAPLAGVAVANTTTTISARPSAEYEAIIRWHFWYDLWFSKVFPQVSDWWFGSAWTQLVRLSVPLATVDNGATVTGLMPVY